MICSGTYWKAKYFLTEGLVKPDGETDQFFYFKVKGYDIRISKIGNDDNCTCLSASAWRVGELCSHILSCKWWIKNENKEKFPTKADLLHKPTLFPEVSK